MKKMIALTVIAAMALMMGQAFAVPEDIDTWWGNTGATPDPYPDPKGRSGHWWYPAQPESDTADEQLYGNRGVVYHIWKKETPPAPGPGPEAPVPGPEPVVKRELPLPADFLFDFDKSDIKPEGKVVLDTKVLPELQKDAATTLHITGHTCDIGSDEYNMGLGQRRADSVKGYLSGAGIDGARLSTSSNGETTPAVPNTDSANRKLNRRVVMDFSFKD